MNWSLQEAEKEHIIKCLKENTNLKLSSIAELLGIGRKTLYIKLKNYGVDGYGMPKS